MITVDTTVVVAGLSPWHDDHALAAAALDRADAVIGHVLVESWSTLTRLPPPYRASPDVARRALLELFPGTPLVLPAEDHHDLLEHVAASGLPGGAVYDALVGLTAARAAARLLSLDARAARAYDVVGADFELLRH